MYTNIKWDKNKRLYDANGDLIFNKMGENLPNENKNIEYLICLSDGTHWLAYYEGDNTSGWFYVEDMPAQYPVAYMLMPRYMK